MLCRKTSKRLNVCKCLHGTDLTCWLFTAFIFLGHADLSQPAGPDGAAANGMQSMHMHDARWPLNAAGAVPTQLADSALRSAMSLGRGYVRVVTGCARCGFHNAALRGVHAQLQQMPATVVIEGASGVRAPLKIHILCSTACH